MPPFSAVLETQREKAQVETRAFIRVNGMDVDVVSHLGWADVAFSTVLVEGHDESLTHGAKSKRRREKKTF